MAQNARFAWITDSSVPRSNAECDREILRSERYVAVPSIGALVPGWTLVVPRRPLRNLSEVTHEERNELAEIVDLLARRLAREDEEIFCFEHGSREAGSLTGCGVDQAHLHIVPLGFDLLEATARRADSAIRWDAPMIAAAPLESLPREGEYIAVWRMTDQRTMIGNVIHPVSQWMRRVIADELGIGSEWNYRTNPQNHNVRMTLAMMTKPEMAAA